jgi:hypothetical protein
MVDKETAVKKGSPAPNVAVFARFHPYGRENGQWDRETGAGPRVDGRDFQSKKDSE